MTVKLSEYRKRILGLIRSSSFYKFVLIFFVFESVWIAFSALYPEAFDENFHFGLIKIYSHYWLPFLTNQPAHANAYGAVARDPSYLYHYLMSFPYRFLALFIHGQAAQVISLRLLDIGLFATGLMLFKRVLIRVGVSEALANISILLFILIPIVPQLAAQVSYDDLLFPLVAWVCLQTFKITDEIKQHKPRFKSLMWLLIISTLTSLVKYAFLPIFVGIVLYLSILIYREYKHSFKKFWYGFVKDFKHQTKWVKVGLITLLIISLGLIMQRDGYNLIKYHSVEPSCNKVLSLKSCRAYSAWYVDYLRHQQLLAGSTSLNQNILSYTWQWFYWMWYRMFFAVNGATSGFYNNPPLLLPAITAAVLAVAIVYSAIKWRLTIFKKNPYLFLLLTISAAYLIALFAKGYASYRYTSYLENMNGRYLIPVLLPIAAIGGLGIRSLLKRSETKKVIVTVVIVCLFLEGGGLLTFIVNSDSSWYWHNNTVNKVNKIANKIVRHVIINKDIRKAN